MIVYEAGNVYRQIHTDGRKLPEEINLPSFYGYSTGHWEADTLVVETAGFNDKIPLDIMGHPRSESMRTIERFRRRDFGHLDYEITFDDPMMYTKPLRVKLLTTSCRTPTCSRTTAKTKRIRCTWAGNDLARADGRVLAS